MPKGLSLPQHGFFCLAPLGFFDLPLSRTGSVHARVCVVVPLKGNSSLLITIPHSASIPTLSIGFSEASVAEALGVKSENRHRNRCGPQSVGLCALFSVGSLIFQHTNALTRRWQDVSEAIGFAEMHWKQRG